MADCPEKDCYQRGKDVHDEMFLPGRVKDRVQCIERKKIPWFALTWVIPVFLTVTGIVGGFIYKSYAEGQKQQNEQIKEIKSDFKKDHDILVSTVAELKKNNENLDKLLIKLDKIADTGQDAKSTEKER